VSSLPERLPAIRALIRALLLGLVAAALLVGPPLVLVTFVGNPLPTVVPSSGDVRFALTSGQIDSWTWIKGLAVVGWMAWAHLAFSFTIELAAAVRGGKARAIRGLGATQWLAAKIITQCSLAASVLLQSSLAPAGAALPPLPVVANVIETEGSVATVASGHEMAAADTPASVSEQDQLEITVGRRDTLWSLAETHLGDGNRWEAIRDANAGRTMADGTVLPKAFTRVERGWTLLVPGVDQVGLDRARIVTPADDVMVAKGDNLWRLSERQLESVDPDPSNAAVLGYVNEVVAHNDHAIDDPDLIYPGQVFALPDIEGARNGDNVLDGPGPEGPTSDPIDYQHAEHLTADDGNGLGSEPGSGLDGTELAHDLSSRADQEDSEPLLLTEPYQTIGSVTMGAAGAILATGAMSLLRRRRRYRMAHRTPGTVVASPLPDHDPVQLALLRHGDEETVAWLQAAMASLTARPVWEGEEVAQPLMATLSGDHLDVEFSSPDSMAAPLPWATLDDGLHWHLPRLVPLEELVVASDYGPVPTLVTVGVDTMINLEAVGLLAIEGPAPSPMDLIRSLVHELATSGSAGTIDVRSTMPIAGTDSYGLVQVQDPQAMVAELVPWLDDVARQLDDGQSNNAYAHRLVNVDEPLGPVVIVTDRDGLAQLDPLADYARSGSLPLAMVVAGSVDADYTIEASPHSAQIQPWDETIEPQLLSQDVAEALGSLLVDADGDDEEPLLVGVELSASVAEVRRPDRAQRPEMADSADDAEHDEPAEQVGLAEAITIRVLGHVDAVGTPDLTSQQLSMLAYLACHGPSTKASLIDGLWDGQVISQSRFPNLLAEVRARIGRNHLPEARNGHYELSGVTTDLARFEQGAHRAQRESDDEAIETLRSILELVRGVPLTPPGRRFWSWVGDHTHLAARVEALVADTAARLARLELAQGNLDQATWACERGLMASPTDETLIILLTETYLAQGKRGLANRLVDNWEDKISRLDCGEPSDAPRRRLVGLG
jgi:DNA-binding SARP family transcriptional activator